METKHKPVLLQEVIWGLEPKPGGTYVDCTLGGGGHSQKIIEELNNNGRLIVLDQDQEAIERFTRYLLDQGYEHKEHVYTKAQIEIYVVNENFRNLDRVLTDLGVAEVDGVLADLGLSTDQLDASDRGFSFMKHGELDMRMSPGLQVKAKDLLNVLYKKELEKLFAKYADIEFATRLANEVIKFRRERPIETTKDLKQIIQRIVPKGSRSGTNRHPEARVFQALRIAVNDEINALREFIPKAFETLAFGGRLAIISFHSGEDKIVKKRFKNLINNNLAKEPMDMMVPSKEETMKNPNSRSAKLRIIQKLNTAHETIQNQQSTIK